MREDYEASPERRQQKVNNELQRQENLWRSGHCVSCSGVVEEINLKTGSFYRRCSSCRKDEAERAQKEKQRREALWVEHQEKMEAHYPR